MSFHLKVLAFLTTLIFLISYPILASENEEERPIRVLAIDGGGMRGLVPLDELKDVESEFGKPLCDIFDLIIGTSTGGLIALGASHGRKAAEMEALYRQQGKEIFNVGWLYWLKSLGGIRGPSFEIKHLTEVAKSFIGQQNQDGSPVYLSDAKTHTGVTFYDLDRRQTYTLTSYEPKDDVLMLDAALLTSAAPTYFPKHTCQTRQGKKIEGVDGGVTNNNPALTAYRKARELFPDRKIVVLSLGTGQYMPPIQFANGGLYDFLIKSSGIDIFTDGQVKKAHKDLRGFCEVDNNAYFRINPKLPHNIGLSSTKIEDWEALLAAARSLSAKKVLREFFDYVKHGKQGWQYCGSKTPEWAEFDAHIQSEERHRAALEGIALISKVIPYTILDEGKYLVEHERTMHLLDLRFAELQSEGKQAQAEISVRDDADHRLYQVQMALQALYNLKAKTTLRLAHGFVDQKLFACAQLGTLLVSLGCTTFDTQQQLTRLWYPQFLQVMDLPFIFEDYDKKYLIQTLETLERNTDNLLKEARDHADIRAKDTILIAREVLGAESLTPLDERPLSNVFNYFTSNIDWSPELRFNFNYLLVDVPISSFFGEQDQHKKGLRLIFDALFTTGSLTDFKAKKVMPGLEHNGESLDVKKEALYQSLAYLVRARMNVSVLIAVLNSTKMALEPFRSQGQMLEYPVYFG